jgi:protein MpaA
MLSFGMESPPRYPQRLGKNRGSYQGETIDIHKLLKDIQEIAGKTGWSLEPLNVSESLQLPAFQKIAKRPRKHLYISSGMHGDEPAGPLALLRLFEEDEWPDDISLFVIPCLNPGGFMRNTRENEEGVDLNRDYRSRTSTLVRAHIRWLEQRPRFDLSLLLHEDWEANGFYLYELNPDLQPALGEAMIQRVKDVCPIDDSVLIDGREAKDGIICANRYLKDRPDWPEAFYLIHHKTRLSYTLEGPSDFPLLTRVNALAAAVRAALEAL